MPKYEPQLVDTIMGAMAEGLTPQQIMETGRVSVPAGTVMSIIRDGKEHGWDDIKAVEAGAVTSMTLDDGPDEVETGPELLGAAAVDHQFGEGEVIGVDDYNDPDDDMGEPSSVHDMISQVSARAAEAKKPRHARRGKAPNRTNNPTLNKARRRREGGDPLMARKRLLADMKRLNPDFTYRWVLDRPGRVRQLTKFDDWDVVTDAHIEEATGGAVMAVAGRNDYEADNMVLLRKPMVYHRDDQIEKAAAVDAMDNMIKKGAQGEKLSDFGSDALQEVGKNADLSNTYVPKDAANDIGRVSESLD